MKQFLSRDLLKKILWVALLIVIGVYLGCIIEYNLSVGYEMSDLFKFVVNKFCSLLQSFAFVILIIAIMLRNSIIDLIHKVRDNVDVIAEGWVKNRIHEQENFKPNQETHQTGLGGLNI